MTNQVADLDRPTAIQAAWEGVIGRLIEDAELGEVAKLAETENSVPELEALMRQGVGEGMTSLRQVAASLTSTNGNGHGGGQGNRRGEELQRVVRELGRGKVPLGLLIRVRLIPTEEDFDRAVGWLREGRELKTDAHDRVLHPDTGEVLGLVQKTQRQALTHMLESE